MNTIVWILFILIFVAPVAVGAWGMKEFAEHVAGELDDNRIDE